MENKKKWFKGFWKKKKEKQILALKMPNTTATDNIQGPVV